MALMGDGAVQLQGHVAHRAAGRGDEQRRPGRGESAPGGGDGQGGQGQGGQTPEEQAGEGSGGEVFARAFERVDVIMGPTSPTTAFPLGSRTDDPVAMYLSDIYTIAVNLAGLPGISVPVAHADRKPVGLQIIGNYFQEGRLLNVAHALQQATDWHQAAPPGFE